ncbi:DUF1826 domain-containing protein [Novosphingobium sp. FGD1]|uniref:DUF1826 domain-containing protein n=1 Tax=Novosphingobium silvae TaxID=2692619 RepID=A0A7X4K9K6_9SPHN|nr:DUF1826 domain-containing protein [Novosphingobium silvae]
MSIAALERTGAAWIADEDSAVLERIHERHVQLALWQRRRPRALDWLDSLDFDEIDDVQKTLAVESLAFCLPGILLEAGYPDGAHTALSQEIGTLACLYAQIMEVESIRMRLEIVETDACRKFHMDNVKARLLMPFTEPGTEWIEVDAAPDSQVRHLRAGAVGLFKGRIWAETPAILHRSPPIAGTGVSRLLLVLDLASPTAFAEN